jgi:hypothetical protein
MMGRQLYVWLVGLHPRHFRESFAEEMIGIYDEHTGNWGRAALFIDVLVSLFRQWMLRPAYREPALSAALAGESADTLLFHMLDSSWPRRSALVNGAILSLVFFSAMAFFIGRGAGASLGRFFVHTGPAPAQSVGANGAAVWHGDFKPPAEDPAYPFANAYFRMIRVLDVLDADHDWIISPWEIINAPAALRRLDSNHDGKLSPEECGFYLGANPKINLDPQRVQRERLRFMRLNPVLAALDTDHDGEISAGEIKNSWAALRTLDQNRDCSLTPDELLPGPLTIKLR